MQPNIPHPAGDNRLQKRPTRSHVRNNSTPRACRKPSDAARASSIHEHDDHTAFGVRSKSRHRLHSFIFPYRVSAFYLLAAFISTIFIRGIIISEKINFG